MATQDYEIELHRPLAKRAWALKVQYKNTFGITEEQFWDQYNAGEMALSTIFENAFVFVCESLNIDVKKDSKAKKDFTNDGDKKIVTLSFNNYIRFRIRNCKDKIGTIYATAWNSIKQDYNYFAIPFSEHSGKKDSINIVVDRVTGEVTSPTYKKYQCDSFEDMCKII